MPSLLLLCVLREGSVELIRAVRPRLNWSALCKISPTPVAWCELRDGLPLDWGVSFQGQSQAARCDSEFPILSSSALRGCKQSLAPCCLLYYLSGGSITCGFTSPRAVFTPKFDSSTCTWVMHWFITWNIMIVI